MKSSLLRNHTSCENGVSHGVARLPKRRSAFQIARLIPCILIALLTQACQTTGSGARNDAPFCSAAKPIYWSAKDTAATIGQVKEHNAVGKALCEWGKK